MRAELSTRGQILVAAQEMFAREGFTTTTISGISSAVGIGESTIYEHFRNKEDILFSIFLEKTEELIQMNEAHLRGLVGARAKLRKLVWNYFEFVTTNVGYTNLLLFELRGNREFYASGVYDKWRALSAPFETAVEEGKQHGEFTPSLNTQVLLYLIFGAIDLMLITWLLKDRIDDPFTYLDPFLTFLDRATICQEPYPPLEDRRRKIIESAVSVFSRVGYNKARIQDIAKLAGVGDGTIYQYFKNKQEILFTIPFQPTRDLISIHGAHFRDIKDTELRLLSLIYDYLNFCDLNKEYSSIVLLELRFNRDFYKAPAYELFREFGRIFYDVIRDGMARGHFRQDVNPYIAVKAVLGAIDHGMLSWIMFNTPETLARLSGPLAQLILGALKP